MPKGVWAPGVLDQPVETLVGKVEHGASEHLTQWHALEVQRLRSDAPEVLGDHRDSLLVTTPSHFLVELAASKKSRTLRTAVRRHLGHANAPLHCEVFWNNGSQLQSLAQLKWDAAPKTVSEEWRPLQIEVPAEAGRLEFVSRNPVPGSKASSGHTVAWQTPWVGNLTAVESSNSGEVLAEPPVAALPDVILLSVDTFRADALEHAPELKAFLERGQLWTNAVSPSNWTLPSYASLFTGREPTEHGAGRGSFAPAATGQVEERNLTPIYAGQTTLAQVFRQRGYATAMIHQSPMLESWTGFAHGFEKYLRLNDQTSVALHQAQDWWQQNSGRPRFLVLQLMAPHLPYRYGPEPDPLESLDLVSFFLEDHTVEQRKQFFDLSSADRALVRQRYDEEVRRMDRELGPWLRQIVPTTSVFAFHSDHGEEFWEADSFEHGHSFNDAVIRVPVALVAPGRLTPNLSADDVPAHGIGGSLLAALGWDDPWPIHLENPSSGVSSSMPFYRAATGGRRLGEDDAGDIPFRPQLNSGGDQAAISSDKMRMLEELGYLAAKDQAWDGNNQAPGNK
jgi:arylsulfatase A-like enzyme